jgi:quercetin dioxygenase-like cupin family protein
MSIVPGLAMEPMVGDPDDHRPNTRWAFVTDPGDDDGRVEHLALIREAIAVGDAIPLHTHDVDEAITILSGAGTARLGGGQEPVSPGAVVFIPAGVPHGTINTGDVPLEIHAAFPRTTIEIAMLERNPAPGTEGDAPRRNRYDLRTGEVTPVD